ncbi:MAG: cation transporter [Spirulina sp. SIO3F2]|nr:cation transporter [Spirulina sp. SIO3F2]
MTHHHSHPTPSNYNRAFLIGLILNGGFVVIEFVMGIGAGSMALVADAGHNLSDVLGLVLAWVATVLTRRQPSSRYTYGWRKSSILAAFLNGLLLLVGTGAILWESVERLFTPEPVQGGLMIIVAAIGVVINTGTALLFVGDRNKDLNIQAAFTHMAADALVSVGVVLGGVGIVLTHWLWLDPVLSMGIGVVIVMGSWGLLKDSFNLAIDAVPNSIEELDVRQYLGNCPGVTQVHDLHIWNLSTVETALTAHLMMPSGHPGDEFLSAIATHLETEFGIHHTTIQIEQGDQLTPCPLRAGCEGKSIAESHLHHAH